MNILLTGGTGYIGSHTAIALNTVGHQIVLYDNLSNSHINVLTSLEKITGQSPIFIEGDIRDTSRLKEVLSHHSIDAVIHFAGHKAVGESVQVPIEYYANNVQGTISLLQAMESAQIHNLVFSSSATVYGDPQYLPIDEKHPTGPTNPSGRTKLHIEEILRDLVNANAKWRVASLRYFNPVGAHESGLIGENPNGIPNNLMPFIAQVAVGKLACLNIFGNDYPTPDGTGVRDYIHIMDLAEGHVAALAFLSKNPGWHTINLGTGQGYSVLDIVTAFELASQTKIPYSMTKRRPGDISTCYADVQKAKELLAWQAQRNLNDICSSTWKFQTTLKNDLVI